MVVFLGQEDHADEDHAHADGKAQAEPERGRRRTVIVVVRVNQGHLDQQLSEVPGDQQDRSRKGHRRE